MHSTVSLADPIVCRCLGVTESQIRDAINVYACESVKEITCVNEAGAGCTVCHCRIRQLLAEARLESISARSA